MKLEVGKKYVVRDPENTGIRWVRVDAIREDLAASRPMSVAACTAMSKDNGKLEDFSCGIDGCYWGHGGSSACDLVAAYTEPEFRLGPEHVGKRVLLKDGTISLLIGYCPRRGINFVAHNPNPEDIMEVLN